MRKHALVVGINRYDDLANINPLQFAEQDAARVTTFLRERAGFTVTELIGSAARHAAIGDAVKELCSELAPGDLFVCYFSGHGFENILGQSLLLAADVRLEDLKQGAYAETVPLRFLESGTASCGASRILLLDICRAPLESALGVVELTSSVVHDTKVLCQTASSENPPLAVVYCCSEHQKAYGIVDPEVNGGAFSHALLQALNDHLKAGRELAFPDDLEEVAEHCRHVLERHLFGCRQEPWCATNRDRVVLLEAAHFPLPEELEKKRDDGVAAGLRRAADEKQAKGDHAASWKRRLPLQRATRQKIKQEERMRVAESQKAAEDERRRQETKRQTQLRRGKQARWTLGIAVALGVALAAWWLTMPPPQSETQVKQVPSSKTVTQQPRSGTFPMEFVSILPGEFVIGCSPGDDNCYADEEPAHSVKIAKRFEMGKYEVTQAQWMSVMGSNPSYFKGADRPVENVSWTDVQEFLKRLNTQGDGHRYRLPTEEEWEYAARAGTTRPHLGSLDAFTWYDGNSSGQTHPVGQKQPNAWGLYDVQGNVWEWVEDWYGDYSVGKRKGRSATDPTTEASRSGRVVRGGSWVTLTYEVRLSVRFTFTPENRSNNIGLRCLREKSP